MMDWATRSVLSWRLSNSMDSSFCVEPPEEAIARHGKPEIFNTDQGNQSTSYDFIGVPREHKIEISMDGKGRWMDNVFIERLWRSLKYEQVYLAEHGAGSEARAGIGWWIAFYNERRPHSALDGLTPDEAYAQGAARRLGLRPASSQPEDDEVAA